MRVAASLALLFLARGAFAQGGPPLRTDDPGTPGPGRFELNLAATYVEAGGERERELPLVDFNYGIGERLQLKYEVPWVDAAELGDSLVGVKWRFQDARDGVPALSTYPQVGFGNGDESLFLPLEAQWDLGTVSLGAEIGREFREHAADAWIGGVAIGRHLSEEVELLAEVHGETHAGVFDVGTRVRFSEGCSLLASVGTGLWSQDGVREDSSAYVGLQFRF